MRAELSSLNALPHFSLSTPTASPVLAAWVLGACHQKYPVNIAQNRQEEQDHLTVALDVLRGGIMQISAAPS